MNPSSGEIQAELTFKNMHTYIGVLRKRGNSRHV